MSNQTYILKHLYHERNAQREYIGHVQRLQKIMDQGKKADVKKKANKQKKIQQNMKQNHQKAQEFKEQQAQQETKTSNKALINKLLQINSNNTTKRIMQDQKMKSIGSLNAVKNKQVQEEIRISNQKFATRMVNLPPVIKMKQLKEETKKQAQIGKQILRFHYLKPKKEKKYERMERPEFEEEENELDHLTDKQLDDRVQIVITVKDIFFTNMLPINEENEKYYLEIKSSIKPTRITTGEMYNDFAKQVINEFLYLRELKENKKIYIGLYQQKIIEKKNKDVQEERFLGDFEIDLTPYYLEDNTEDLTFDLRNWKEASKNPNYMPTDMRKKGHISFQMKVKSKAKEYLLDTMQRQPINEEEEDQEQDHQKQQQDAQPQQQEEEQA